MTHEFAVVRRHNLVLGLQQARVDHALDAVLQQVGLVDRLLRRLRDFEHEGPVRARSLGLRVDLSGQGRVCGLHRLELDVGLRAIVWRVVGEDGGAVEGRVGLGAVSINETSAAASRFAASRKVDSQVEPALVADTRR